MRAILESALERPACKRPGYVAAACGADAALYAEVLALISAHDGAAYLEQPPDPFPDRWPGKTLGPWKLVRRIGEGGMGTVYEAVRADQQYEQRVAIKLVQASALSEETTRRFWNERQLLAQLEHPHIARLLDGGTAEDGVPYLVMEYVEGMPVDRFCEERQLSIQETLDIFLSICAAVEHAHRNLVVHRDIKPGNILVTGGGLPKLLDFGIAKLLTGGGPELTTPAQRVMTPAYASPEQISGQRVTTATDVYSLGVLLYRLLAGHLPYTVNGEREELERAILKREPLWPSQVAAEPLRERLRGDLDAIVMTAIRKEPDRRYLSVQRLADDVARYRDGLPVSARKDTAAYRAAKFIRRHRAGALAAALTVVTLIAATGISIQFARQAGAERSRAVARFDDVRRLANFFLFEFDDAVGEGTTAARRRIVAKGLESLNRLASDTKNDVALGRELMAGYLKIGDIQGNIFSSNLGQVGAAKDSYLRALGIAKSILAAERGSTKSRRDVALAYHHLGEIAATAGNYREALDCFRQALPLIDPLPLHDQEGVEAALKLHSRIAWVFYHMGRYPEALSHYERYEEIVLQFYGSGGSSARRPLTYARERKGETLARMGNSTEGLMLLKQALKDYRILLREEPGTERMRDVLAVQVILGDLLHAAGRNEESLVELRSAVRQIKAMMAADPRNSEYQRDYSEALTQMSDALFDSGHRKEAKEATRLALKVMRDNRQSASQWDLYQYARVLLITPFPEFHDNAEALIVARRVFQDTDRTDPSILDLFARALDATGDVSGAVEMERQALGLLSSSPSDIRREVEKNLAGFELHRRSSNTPAKPKANKNHV